MQLTSLLSNFADRFKVDKLDTTCYVSLVNGDKNEVSLTDYLDEIQNLNPDQLTYVLKNNTDRFTLLKDGPASCVSLVSQKDVLDNLLDQIEVAIVGAGGKINSRALLAL